MLLLGRFQALIKICCDPDYGFFNIMYMEEKHVDITYYLIMLGPNIRSFNSS